MGRYRRSRRFRRSVTPTHSPQSREHRTPSGRGSIRQAKNRLDVDMFLFTPSSWSLGVRTGFDVTGGRPELVPTVVEEGDAEPGDGVTPGDAPAHPQPRLALPDQVLVGVPPPSPPIAYRYPSWLPTYTEPPTTAGAAPISPPVGKLQRGVPSIPTAWRVAPAAT